MTDLRIEKLTRYHRLVSFDCGNESLNNFLIRFALTSQQANASQTYLGLAESQVIGFYTLVVGEVRHDEAAARLVKGLARHPVPVMVLARLGVSLLWQRKKVGAGLLKDAMRRTLTASEIAGVRALVVHAKDDAGRSFYEHFEFAGSPADDRYLYLLVKEMRRIVSGLS